MSILRFAFLREEKRKMTVPPKYLSTRWTIWRDCSEWWLDHLDLFRRFIHQEIGIRSTAMLSLSNAFIESNKAVAENPLFKLLTVRVAEMKATLAFTIEETRDICELINLTQTVKLPVATTLVHRLAALENEMRYI